ncbi:MAG: hypothetical protein E7393_05540 [Ruminococcaceae bacterium]|nr:hypothetical protein [Oscillospiraceae bacterium]
MQKKKVYIVGGVIVLVLGLILLAGYFAIDKMFSIFSDSFYQVESVRPTALPEETLQPNESPDAATQSAAPPLETATPNLLPENMQFSASESKALIESVSFSDKLRVMAILQSSLSSEEYKTMFSMLSGGISQAEIQRAKAILSRRLSPDEKKEILGYYQKYSDLLK